MRNLLLSALLPVLVLFAGSGAAAQQPVNPGQPEWEIYKLRFLNTCTGSACNSTYNTWFGWNSEGLAASTSLKGCAQVEVETTDFHRYAVRVPLQAMGAKSRGALQEQLDQQLAQEKEFVLKTWRGTDLVLLPRLVLALNVERCH